MANEYLVNSADLTAVADAIRTKGGTSGALTFPSGFVEAVGAIVSGGSSGGLAYDMGEFVLKSDVNSNIGEAVSHQLGEIPEFVMVWTDDFAGITSDNPVSQQCYLGYIWLYRPMGLMQRLSSTNTGEALTVNFNLNINDYRISPQIPTATSYLAIRPTKDVLYLHKISNNQYWRAGVSYKYFVSKAWWNVGGVANA